MAADPKAHALAQRKLEAAGKYLTFFLESEEYGIPILKVQQIIGVTSITVVPRTICEAALPLKTNKRPGDESL